MMRGWLLDKLQDLFEPEKPALDTEFTAKHAPNGASHPIYRKKIRQTSGLSL
jgi:hypothetical protein